MMIGAQRKRPPKRNPEEDSEIHPIWIRSLVLYEKASIFVSGFIKLFLERVAKEEVRGFVGLACMNE